MLNFSERFMEDCIDEAPDAFIEGFGTMIARQGSIAGFRPDLLFRDTSGKLCILEIQKQALDRSHLYKCLEYRDLVHEREENSGTLYLILLDA
jgi:RecB family endonuclease NucS